LFDRRLIIIIIIIIIMAVPCPIGWVLLMRWSPHPIILRYRNWHAIGFLDGAEGDIQERRAIRRLHVGSHDYDERVLERDMYDASDICCGWLAFCGLVDCETPKTRRAQTKRL
jgi:hypothetical protein